MRLSLFGDSTLDNAIYTEDGVSTMDLVCSILPDWEVECLATSHSSVQWHNREVSRSAWLNFKATKAYPLMLEEKEFSRKLWESPYLAVLAMGRNDLYPKIDQLIKDEELIESLYSSELLNPKHINMRSSDLLGKLIQSLGHLKTVGDLIYLLQSFPKNYSNALGSIRVPTLVTTVISPNFNPKYKLRYDFFVGLFNQIIKERAFHAGQRVDIIELDKIMQKNWYANEIELNARGTQNLAKLISGWAKSCKANWPESLHDYSKKY